MSVLGRLVSWIWGQGEANVADETSKKRHREEDDVVSVRDDAGERDEKRQALSPSLSARNLGGAAQLRLSISPRAQPFRARPPGWKDPPFATVVSESAAPQLAPTAFRSAVVSSNSFAQNRSFNSSFMSGGGGHVSITADQAEMQRRQEELDAQIKELKDMNRLMMATHVRVTEGTQNGPDEDDFLTQSELEEKQELERELLVKKQRHDRLFGETVRQERVLLQRYRMAVENQRTSPVGYAEVREIKEYIVRFRNEHEAALLISEGDCLRVQAILDEKFTSAQARARRRSEREKQRAEQQIALEQEKHKAEQSAQEVEALRRRIEELEKKIAEQAQIPKEDEQPPVIEEPAQAQLAEEDDPKNLMIDTDRLEGIYYGADQDTLLSQNFSIDLCKRHVAALQPGDWLNSEVIGYFVNLLELRCLRPGHPLKISVHNTFFYTRLASGKEGYDYKDVRRWGRKRKVKVLDADLVVIPINAGNSHWYLGVIDVQHKRTEVYDSMASGASICHTNLLRYYMDEWKEINKEDLDTSDWTQLDKDNVPQQRNCDDCGAFMLYFAWYRIFGFTDFPFSQKDIPHFRNFIGQSILNHIDANPG